jgi:hypothetical protein
MVAQEAAEPRNEAEWRELGARVTPTLADFARWFVRFPNELARLAELDRAEGNLPLKAAPTGSRTTPKGFARFFADRPELLRELGATLPEPEPRPSPCGRLRKVY